MQIPGSLYLGSHDRSEALLILIEQQAIIEDAGGVDDPS